MRIILSFYLFLVSYLLLIEFQQHFIGAKCSSWNGKACGAGETANVGRGPGSCNSNNDCPCCAPFCSKYGYCQNYQ